MHCTIRTSFMALAFIVAATVTSASRPASAMVGFGPAITDIAVVTAVAGQWGGGSSSDDDDD